MHDYDIYRRVIHIEMVRNHKPRQCWIFQVAINRFSLTLRLGTAKGALPIKSMSALRSLAMRRSVGDGIGAPLCLLANGHLR